MASSILNPDQSEPPSAFSWRGSLRRDVRAFWPLWLIVAAATLLRLWDVHRLPGFNGDEAWYGVQVQQLLAGRPIDWRTPTGNVPGLLQIGSLWLLHSVFSPSLLLLRIPALLSSLAALAMAYAVGRRFFGATAGMTALVMMASFPAAIAYARLGWDPSHAPLLALIAIYAAFAGRHLLSALFFAFALATHPATVFAAPMLTLASFGFERQRKAWWLALAGIAPYVGMLLLAILFSLILSVNASHYLDAGKSAARLVDPVQAFQFVVQFGRLLSGDTIYRFMAGEGYGAAMPVVDAITAFSALAILAGGFIVLRRRPDWRIVGVLAGWLASLAALYVVTGPWALRPSLERFAFPMVPLTALAIAVMMERWFGDGKHKALFQVMMAAIAMPLIAGFWLFYMKPLDSGATRPNAAFWTGRPEPHQAAFDTIAAAAGPAGARIMAEDWWLYWPAAYQSAGKPFLVIDQSKVEVAPDAGGLAGNVYWIAYRGGSLDRALARRGDVRLGWTIKTSNPHNSMNIWTNAPRTARGR